MKKPFIKRIIPFLQARFAPRGARISFSQYGEDLIMKDMLTKKRMKEFSYIDIGAHNPIFGNNTYLLYKGGGKGVLVEPNAELCTLIRKKRGRDICLNAGAGKADGEADFYSFVQSTRSTFSKEQADEHQKQTGQIPKIEKKKIVSLDSIIRTHFAEKEVSLVSIDAEGLDVEILSGFSFQKRPYLFCVESSLKDTRVDILMSEKGYKKVAQIFQNAIFVDAQ
jgi:FkbM family methyltransferase